MNYLLTAVLLAAAALAIYLLADYRRRRLTYGFWCRVKNWAYWPMWLFYVPIVLYVFALSLRHRGLTLLTAVNPGLEQGGVALVAKDRLLEQLMRQPDHVAPFTLIEPSDAPEHKRRQLGDFVEKFSLSYPLVVKPNFGERGRAVRIVQDEADALAYLESCREPMLAQQYVPGKEYGIYFLRHPHDDQGRIVSLTAKNPAFVIGDGNRSLERLILDDPRLICYAHLLLKEFAPQLDHIVADGETFTLTELRSHWRGADFVEVEELRSPELEKVFLDLSGCVEGFHVGRYDVRAHSPEEMRAGAGFRVIELNSVMSEPIQMYDAKYSLFGAYGIMFGLWGQIIAIGAANRTRGANPLSVREFFEMIGAYRRHRRAQA